MKKIAVLFSGEGTNFRYLAKNLPDYGIEIALAITNNPKAGGIKFAKEYGIDLKVINHKDYPTREEFDLALVKALEPYSLDLVVLAGFMRVLTPTFTNRVKAINLHPSLLPRHKGLEAIRRSWEDEHSEGGVSVHWVDSKLDSGEIIVQYELEKDGFDSLMEYEEVIRQIEKEALLEAIVKILKDS